MTEIKESPEIVLERPESRVPGRVNVLACSLLLVLMCSSVAYALIARGSELKEQKKTAREEDAMAKPHTTFQNALPKSYTNVTETPEPISTRPSKLELSKLEPRPAPPPDQSEFRKRMESGRTAVLTTQVSPNIYGAKRNETATGSQALRAESIKHSEGEYLVRPGTILKAVLLTGLISDLPGKILARTTEPIYDSRTGKALLIPPGTTLEGTYQNEIAWGQNRVNFSFNRITLPDNRAIAIREIGTDAGGASGLTGAVDNHYLRLFGAVLISSTLSAGTRVAQGQNQTFNPSFEQMATQGAAQNIDNVGQQIVGREIKIAPTITVDAGEKVSLILSDFVALPEY